MDVKVQASASAASRLGKKLRPAPEIRCLRLIECHCFIDADFSPEQEFHFVFGEGTKLPSVRLEPHILLLIRASHPMWEPVIEFPCGLIRIRRVSVSREDCVLLRFGHSARSIGVPHTCE